MIKTSIRNHWRWWHRPAFEPTHYLWVCIGRIDKDTSVLNLRSKWSWVVSYTLRLIYFQERVLGTQMTLYCCALEQICKWTRKIIRRSGSQPWPFHEQMVATYIIILPRDRTIFQRSAQRHEFVKLVSCNVIFIVVPCILILSMSFHFTKGCALYLFSSTLKFTLKYTLKLLLHVSV